jgi:hypothetical protein
VAEWDQRKMEMDVGRSEEWHVFLSQLLLADDFGCVISVLCSSSSRMWW